MDKAKRAEERERKHEEAQARLARMTEEERTAHEERRKVGRGVGREALAWPCSRIQQPGARAAVRRRPAPHLVTPVPPQAIREAAAAERARSREHTRGALGAPLKLVIDLDFDGMMTVSEVRPPAPTNLDSAPPHNSWQTAGLQTSSGALCLQRGRCRAGSCCRFAARMPHDGH